MRSKLLVFASTALVTVSLLAAGCGDPGAGASNAQVTELGDQVKRQGVQIDELSDAVAEMSRKLSGLSDDVVTARNTMAEPVAAAESGAEPEAAATATEAVAALDPGALKEALASKEGEEALAKALRSAEQQRDRERMNRMVNGFIDRFAQEANLSEQQSTQMKEISGKFTPQIRDVWRGMRDMMGASSEDRAAYVEEARAKTMELREEMNSEVKLILTADQFVQYEDSQDRMMGGGRGMRGRGGDRGGNR